MEQESKKFSEPETSEDSLNELDDEIELENLRKVEAALFIAGRFLNLRELVALTDVNPILIRRALDELCDKYRDSGIEIVRRGDTWKMDVASEHKDMVNKLASGSSEFTKAEQETLAIIAYKQPIKQSVIVKIRGNKAYEHIKKLVEAGLINKKKTGHTSELNLNENFYDYFQLGKGQNINGKSGEEGEG